MNSSPETQRRRIRRIGPLQVGVVLAAVFGAAGILFGAFGLFVSVVDPYPTSPPGVEPSFWEVRGRLVMVLLPVIYGVIGFIQGVVGSAIYNLVAHWTGGIKVEVE